MRLGVPKETTPGERRVALIPETIGRLPDGVEVVVEADAGAAASFGDEAYREAGAGIGDPWDTELVAKVAWPTPDGSAPAGR
jgi:NAD(P) transhydrogenase subunit alpha